MDGYNPYLRPGMLEVYCGPMKSGKTRELINRIDKIRFMLDNDAFIFFKPRVDTRDIRVKSRFGELAYECVFVNERDPSEMLPHLTARHKLVVIEEAQFFQEGVELVVGEMLRRGCNVLVAGLDLDFRGEPFGRMPQLLAMAAEVYKLKAVCDVAGCRALATRTQRLVNGLPAPYDAPVVLVGDASEGYEARCVRHHVVSGHAAPR